MQQRKLVFPVNEIFYNKEFFYSQGSFPQSRKLSTIKKIFHNQGNFLQSRKFSEVKEIFHNQGNFPQSRKVSTVKTFSANKDQNDSVKTNSR